MDNQLNNEKIEKYYYKKQKKDYKKRKKKREKKGKLSVNSKYMNGMKPGKCFIKEFNELSRSESSIISKLRTEHIELNKYTNIVYAKGEQTSPMCSCGKEEETVKHYLMKCENYNEQRKEMWDTMELIDEFYKEKSNRTIRRLLFYYKYQQKSHLKEKILIRVNLIKEIIKFIIKTKRFEKENIKTRVYNNVKKRYAKEKLREMVDPLSDEESSDSESESDNESDCDSNDEIT